MVRFFRTAMMAISFITASVSFAKEKPVVVDPPESGVVYRDSSAHNRQDKNYQINYQVLGIGPLPTFSSGFQIGKFLDHDSLIFIEMMGGGHTTKWTLSNYDLKANTIGVHYKKFSGNSFYWRAGLDRRVVNLDVDSDRLFSDENSTWGFDGESFALNGQIGNQWQWQNFTMGCDWVGYSLPISSRVSGEYINSTTPEYDEEDLKDEKERLTKMSSVNLLRFYLGASF